MDALHNVNLQALRYHAQLVDVLKARVDSEILCHAPLQVFQYDVIDRHIFYQERNFCALHTFEELLHRRISCLKLVAKLADLFQETRIFQ